MSKIAILADSGCQIELEKYENQGIFIVPLCITMKNKTYLDQKDITSLEVFEIMEKEDLTVKTSQPSTGVMMETVQKIKDLGFDEIIGLPIATGLSSTLNGMKVAADMVDIPITLVDTKGKLLISKDFKIKEASDGNGGTYSSLRESGALADMKERGIKWIFISSIDKNNKQ